MRVYVPDAIAEPFTVPFAEEEPESEVEGSEPFYVTLTVISIDVSI